MSLKPKAFNLNQDFDNFDNKKKIAEVLEAYTQEDKDLIEANKDQFASTTISSLVIDRSKYLQPLDDYILERQNS